MARRDACLCCLRAASLRCPCGDPDATYCSRDCQKVCWGAHRPFCGKNPDLEKTRSVEISCRLTRAPVDFVRIANFNGVPAHLSDVLLQHLAAGYNHRDNEYCMEIYATIRCLWNKYPSLVRERLKTPESKKAWEGCQRLEEYLSGDGGVDIDLATQVLHLVVCEPSISERRIIDILIRLAQKFHEGGLEEMGLLTIVRAQKVYDGFIFYSPQRRSRSSIVAPQTRNDLEQLLRIKRQHGISLAFLRGSTADLKKLERSMRRYKGIVEWRVERDRLLKHMERVEEEQAHCNYCGKGHEDVLPCCACGEVSYCDGVCQAEHWTMHKYNCSFNGIQNWELVARRVVVRERWYHFGRGVSTASSLRCTKEVFHSQRIEREMGEVD
jgi:hypothetical protein